MLDSPHVRIAISGTHCSGKTTLAEDFAAAHREYIHEPEPYEWLEEHEPLAAEPTADDFLRQLELSVERWSSYARGANVIAERSPLDFLAYLLALEDLGRSGRDCAMNATAVELVADGMANIDLLVLLPLEGISAPVEEDLALRDAMNERLLELIATDPHALFVNGSPRVVEIQGTPGERLRLLEREAWSV